MVPVLRQVGAPNGEESNWERKFNRNSPEIANLRKQYPDTLTPTAGWKWIAAEQLSSAQQAAKDAGMHIGIMSDMAVGVHPPALTWVESRALRHGSHGSAHRRTCSTS